MKKLSTLLAVVALAATTSVNAETWCMPGTYQDWKLETNHFELVDGVLQQVIPDLYGDFKIVKYDTSANWDNQWCSNGETVKNGEAYVPVYKEGSNILMDGDNVHYINAKVTITPGDDNAITIMVQAEKVESGKQTWHLVGDVPGWNFTSTPQFTQGEDNVWTLKYEGELTGTFKVVKNATWANAYSTMGAIELGVTYTLTGPQDPLDNMSVTDGPWVNPVFTLTDGENVTLCVTAEAGVNSISMDEVPSTYYNLQGVRVANPDKGIYIRVQGNKATKVSF